MLDHFDRHNYKKRNKASINNTVALGTNYVVDANNR